jgi:hypothetical protein
MKASFAYIRCNSHKFLTLIWYSLCMLETQPKTPVVVLVDYEDKYWLNSLFKPLFEEAGLPVKLKWSSTRNDPPEKFVQRLRRQKADVIIYNVDTPFQSRWDQFLEIRRSADKRDIQSIPTTFGKSDLTRIAGPNDALEVTGDVTSLEEIINHSRDLLQTFKDAA